LRNYGNQRCSAGAVGGADGAVKVRNRSSVGTSPPCTSCAAACASNFRRKWRRKVRKRSFAIAVPRARVRAKALLIALALLTSSISPTSVGAAAPKYDSFEDAVPGVMPPGTEATVRFVDASGQVMPTNWSPLSVSDPQAVSLWCTPGSGRDNPHWSLGDVSGHGWWTKGTCTKDRAEVWNCLAEYYTDHTWRWKACSPLLVLRPGGGAGNRTTARRACESPLVTTWRNYVDVNVIDEADSGEQPFNVANVNCRVFS
jgi:hypothetical protein